MKNLISLYLLLTIIVFFVSCDETNNIEMNLKFEQIESSISCSQKIEDCYGICSQIARNEMDFPYIDEILEIMEDLHVTWVRCDFDWSSVSKLPNDELNFSLFDKVFEHLDKHPNIQLLPIISIENSNYSNTSNSDLAIIFSYENWQKYVKETILRYKEKCSIWESYSALDQYVNKKILTYEEGLQYQKDFNEIVKGITPSIETLSVSLNNSNPSYKNLLVLGYYNYSDFLNFHLYSSLTPESNYLASVDYISTCNTMYNYKDKPIWLTEFGYSTSSNRSTEVEQAYSIPRSVIASFAKGIDKVFLYNLRAREYRKDEPEAHFGITHKDLSPKPAYFSYKNLISMLPSGSTRPKLYNLGQIYLSSWVHPQLGKVYAIWTKEDTINVGLKFEGNAHLYSYMDIENEINIEDYSQFEIGPGITYITGASAISLH